MGTNKNIMSKIKRALISLSDKQNLKPLLNCLEKYNIQIISSGGCLLYTSPSPRDQRGSRMPSSA